MKKYWALILVSVVVLSGWFVGASKIEAQTISQIQNISGWAWSSNVGWIAFGSWPNRVRFETATGNILGYAWNNNIGWIRFDPTGPYPDYYPDDRDLPSHSVKVIQSNPTPYLNGWARACTVFLTGCSGALKSDIQLGGWDGWIKMSSSPYNSDYGVAIGANPNSPLPNSLYGDAWGGDVIGWINFCGASYCTYLDQFNVSCKGTPDPVVIGDAIPDITWQLSVTGNTNPLNSITYSVSSQGATGDPSGSVGPLAYPSASSFTTVEPGVVPSNGKVTLYVEVLDSASPPNTQYGHVVCSVDVKPVTTTEKLTVRINGDGSVADVPVVNINCDSINQNNCSHGYPTSPTQTVTLRANPSSGYTFSGWFGDVPLVCVNSLADCPLTMGRSRIVTATFLPTGTDDTDFDIGVESTLLRIDSHNSGLSVRSPSIKIRNNSTLQGNIDICVKEFTSKVDSSSLNGTIISDPTQMARCYFNNDDNSDQTCDYTDPNGDVSISHVTLAPKGVLIGDISDTADFSIKMPVKLALAKDKSPYKVVIGICGSSSADDKEIEFQYQPLTFEPQ